MTDLHARALAIIAKEIACDAAAVTPDKLLDDICIDMLDRHMIAMTLEDELGIVIGDEEMEGWDSVADVLACVAGKVGETECRA